MSKLFENSKINGMLLANRFVRSATWEGMATKEGAVTPKLISTMEDLARGGVGLIITGHSFVTPEGQAGPWQLGSYKDELISGLREMTSAVHECGGKIIMQLAHAGAFASKKLTGKPPFVVSNRGREGREMKIEDIRNLITAFAEAAQRAKSAGFDGVQIHSGHGYLLSQFLSPLFNNRQDEYGGDINNRARVHLELYRAIRETVGKAYPVLIKMNCQDFVEGGLTLDDAIQFGSVLADAGIDAIELSGGLLTSEQKSPSRIGINTEDKEAYHKEEARCFKEKIGVPLILVGGIRSFEVAENLVEDGVTDYIAMSRSFIREPDLINRWKSGNRSKAKCKSDNLCFGPGGKGEGIYCVVKKRRENPES